MNIREKVEGSSVVLSLEGRLDANTSKELEAKFLQMIDQGQIRFIVDFSSLDYISSAGLRILLVAAKKLKPLQGVILLACMSENVKEVFEMSGFTSIFSVYDQMEDALKEIK